MTGVDLAMLQVSKDVELCVEVIGEHGAPALLLIGGATWSMDWWDEELCRRLAERGRLVVRYDQRDTGRSTSYPPGDPGYTGADLVGDVVSVLDGFGIDRGHVVGLSMGGGIAQRLALEHRERVASLTLIATTPIDPDVGDLPGPTPEILATFCGTGSEPDWLDREAVVDHVVQGERPYAGPGSFDEPRLRELAGRVFDRTGDMAASLTNHFLLADDSTGDRRLSQLDGLPTLVVHGTADPLFPVQHGRALAQAIPAARLLELEDVSHQLPPPHTWDVLVDALVEHTAG